MKIIIDWDNYFKIGFFICLIYFIIDKNWINLMSICTYSLLVLMISIYKTKLAKCEDKG